VAPGSAIGSVSIRGTVLSGAGELVPDIKAELILPAEYGLGGLDLMMSEASDFGHRDARFSVTTDANGEFHQDFGERLYHVSCWLLPPLGCYPEQPPPPYVWIRIDDSPNEYYVVNTGSGEFMVVSLDGVEIPLSDSEIRSIDARFELSNEPGSNETVGVVEIHLVEQ
jgi:hypothetical protein